MAVKHKLKQAAKQKKYVRKAGKAAVGVGKLVGGGTGKKISTAGRTAVQASRVKNMRDAALLADKMRSNYGR